MKTSNLIFLFSLLISFSFYESKTLRKSMNIEDPLLILSELDENHFGNSLMSALSIHLSAESPIDDIITLLNDLKADLLKEQSSADSQNSTDIEKCAKLISEYTLNQNYLQTQINLAEKTINENKFILEISENNYKTVIKNLDDNMNRISENEGLRLRQRENYENQLKNYNDALDVLKETNSLLEHLKAGSSLIQLRRKLENIKTRLTRDSILHSSLYNPLVSALTEIAMNADQENLKKIIELLERLQNSLTEAKNKDEKIERDQLTDYQRLDEDLKNEKKNLLVKKNEGQYDIENYKKIIRDNEDKYASFDQELELVKGLLTQTVEFCEDKGKKYVEESEERKEELEILDRLFVNFNEKLTRLKEYLKNRMNQEF